MSAEGIKAVFLSYASQDAAAARTICDALRAAGVEVWFDQSELVGGDAWDAKIRQQIKECALFLPIISANTQARAEGYFRIEWRLADRRTEAMGKSKSFLVPISIDDTRDSGADVPDSFLAVQWTRLPAGETNAAFCERVKKLLAGPTEAGRPRADVRDVGVASPDQIKRGRRVPLAAWLAGAVVALGVVVWLTQRRPGNAPPPAAVNAPAGSLSEARKLAAKADALFDQDELATREHLTLAEKFCQQAIALDPNDAEVWAIYSRVGSQYIFLTVDRSPERRNQAGDAANRALQLAPNSFEARYARAYFYRLDEASYPEAERILRELIKERPNDRRVWRTLGHTMRYDTIFGGKYRGRNEESIECLQRAIALPGGDPLSLHFLATTFATLGRMDEGEKAMEASLALKRSGAALLQRVNLLIRYAGDVPRAQAALAEVPVEPLREDFGAFIAALVWRCARDPDREIAALKELPRDYMEAVFDGPKGLLIGQAHRIAGRAQAAEVEWRAALQVVERRLLNQSNNTRLLLWKSWLLALLGNPAEARRGFQTAEQLGLTVRDQYWAAGLQLELGDRDKAVALLTAAAKEQTVVTAAFLRIHPMWDGIRSDPRFEVLAKVPEKTPPSTANADPKSVPTDKSIAVLAFKTIGGARESEHYSEGISEELLNLLGTIPGLHVAARASAFYFKDKNATTQEMGRQLNVAYIVDGSVQRAGSTARVNASLSRADTGEQVWSDKFESEQTNILTLQDEIAGRIADKLKLKLGFAPRVLRPVNDEAYRLLLEARHFWNLRTEEGFASAEAALRKALALDSQFARAHAGLADVALMRATYRQLDGETNVSADLARTREEVKLALALDASLPEPPAALAYASLLERRLAEAERGYQQVLAANPNHSVIHMWHGVAQFYTGRLDTALEEFEKAIALDPLSFINLHMASDTLALAGRLDEALALNARATALRSDVWPPSRGDLASLLWQKGRKEEALTAARAVCQLWPQKPRWFADSNAIWVLQQAGQRDEAARYADQLLQNLPETNSHRGLVLAALEKFGEALPYLERSGVMSQRSLFWAPMWDPFRKDPQFAQLLVKLGCVEQYKVARETLTRMKKEGAGLK